MTPHQVYISCDSWPITLLYSAVGLVPLKFNKYLNVYDFIGIVNESKLIGELLPL